MPYALRLFQDVALIERDITMNRATFAVLLSCLFMPLVTAQSALAQFNQQQRFGPPTGYSPPQPISPYIGLLQRGNTTSLTQQYYGPGGVQQNLQTQNAILGLRQQQGAAVQPGVADQTMIGLPETGHNVFFMNYAQYFGNMGGSGLGRGTSGGRSGAAAGGASAPR